MCVTLNLVLESLSSYQFQNHIEKEKKLQFSRLCLLPEQKEDLFPERLYVGTLTDAVSFRRQGADFFCVCVRDGACEPDDPALSSGLIVICEEVSPYRVFSELQELFFRITEWVNQMNRCAYEKRPLLEMLELSESVIGNYISVSDSALSLVCCTRHIETDDPMSLKLMKNGFHPEESVEIFREQGLFEQWEHAKGLIINKSHAFSPYDLCSRVFKLHNTYYIHAVMTCSSRPLTPGMIDLFRMLTDVIEIYVKQDWQEHTFMRHDYDRFLIKLIEGRAGAEGVVENRAKQLCIPLNNRYQLCQIELQTLDKLPIGRIGIELTRQFPESRVTVYQNRILMLFSSYEESEESFFPKDNLSAWLEKADARCAVSSVFAALPEIRTAYEQTQRIFLYFPEINKEPFGMEQRTSRIVEFDRVFQLVMLGDNPESRTMWQTTRCFRMLQKVRKYDEKHGTNNLHLLYTYLFCDCSATETGAQLHMHRNNVLYRIGRIEEMMGAKLSDPAFRYELFCGEAFLQLYGV